MKYTYQDIYDKKLINTPIWACNYEFNIVKFGKEITQEPIQGEIEVIGMGGLIFTPYTKNGNKKKDKSRAMDFVIYQYADTEEECNELYCKILQEKIDWCKETINNLNKIIQSKQSKR